MEPGTMIEYRGHCFGRLVEEREDGSFIVEMANEPGVLYHVRSAGHGKWACLTRLAEVEP